MKTLSFDSKEQKIWIVGDLHLGHDKDFILDPRNYKTVAEAVKHTFEMLHEYVGINDILINLGDVVIGAGANSTEYAKRVVFFPCKHQYFIWGNHNAGIKHLYNECLNALGLFDDELEVYPVTYPNSHFTFLGHRATIFVDNLPVVLDHYPIASWEHLSKGAYHIHGHCHGNLKKDNTLQRVDAGWDWMRRPVEWSEIVREMNTRTPIAPDHHSREPKLI